MRANMVKERLLLAFPERQATVLAETITAAYDELIKVSDFNELKAIVKDLALAQGDLAAAQQRTEMRVEELALAQRQTEKALQSLARQVGGLSDAIGGDIEDIAYITLHEVLQREFGWQVGVLERVWQTWEKEPEEVDIFGQAIDAATPARPVWVVGEAKHNLTLKEAQRFVRQLARARRRLAGDIFAVCFCYRARPEVQQYLSESGVYLAFSYRKLAPPAVAMPPAPAFWQE